MTNDFRQPPRFSYPNPLNAVPARPAPLRPPSVPVRTRPGIAPTQAAQAPAQQRRKRPAARPPLDPLFVALTRMLMLRHLGA
jgi:hypothetical protein